MIQYKDNQHDNIICLHHLLTLFYKHFISQTSFRNFLQNQMSNQQQPQQQRNTLYLTVNKLCEQIHETIKSERNKHHKDTAGLYIIIASNDNIREDRYNQNMVSFKPKAISIFAHEYMDYKELCEFFKCDNLYIKLNKRFINFRASPQIIEIDSVPKEFTNDDGIDICYHETSRVSGIFYKNEINEYQKYMNKKKNAKIQIPSNLTMLSED